jgi:hypothetical protein
MCCSFLSPFSNGPWEEDEKRNQSVQLATRGEDDGIERKEEL